MILRNLEATGVLKIIEQSSLAKVLKQIHVSKFLTNENTRWLICLQQTFCEIFIVPTCILFLNSPGKWLAIALQEVPYLLTATLEDLSDCVRFSLHDTAYGILSRNNQLWGNAVSSWVCDESEKINSAIFLCKSWNKGFCLQHSRGIPQFESYKDSFLWSPLSHYPSPSSVIAITHPDFTSPWDSLVSFLPWLQLRLGVPCQGTVATHWIQMGMNAVPDIPASKMNIHQIQQAASNASWRS